MKNTTDTKPKITSKKIVFKSRNFHIDQITVEKKSKTIIKDIIVRREVVLIIPFNKKNEIYLELQYRDAFEKHILELVAGNMEDGLSPLENAKKELKEETGLSAKTWVQIATWDLSSNMIAKIHVFAASDLKEGETELEYDEIIQTIKMPLDLVLDKISKGEITVASHVAAILLFANLRKEGKL